jgi:crotonobetainyl-CoA:carnitine CoA-transferase CaiB-like acyl-CoA transferase
MNIRYGDSTAGASAALAAIAALHHRERTGEGQFVDLSAVEAMTSLVGDSLFAYSVTGEVPQSDGNYHPEMAPHGAYPCTGTDWISIAVADDDEWRVLCSILAADELAANPDYAKTQLRIANRLALDAQLAGRTRNQDAAELADRLRKAGVPAFKSMSSIDLCSDEYLWNRQGFRMVDHPHNGPRPIIGPSWRMEPDMAKVERGAPVLGEHNDYVYREILGLSQERLDDLIARKVID